MDEGLPILFVGMRVPGSKEHLRWLPEMKTLEVSQRDEVKKHDENRHKTTGPSLKIEGKRNLFCLGREKCHAFWEPGGVLFHLS